MKRRSLILLLGGASSGAMSIGTGAFSSVEAERGVEVNVVEDENAYLGLEQIRQTVSGDDGTRVIQVTNQFGGALDISITVDQRDGTIDEIEGKGIEIEDDRGSDDEDEEDGEEETDENDRCEDDDRVLCIGEEAFITVECEGNGRVEFTLTFDGTVSKTGTTVDRTRTFRLDCDGNEAEANDDEDDGEGDEDDEDDGEDDEDDEDDGEDDEDDEDDGEDDEDDGEDDEDDGEDDGDGD